MHILLLILCTPTITNNNINVEATTTADLPSLLLSPISASAPPLSLSDNGIVGSNPKYQQHYNFDQIMAKLMERLDVIHNMAANILMGFYQPALESFLKGIRSSSKRHHHKRICMYYQYLLLCTLNDDHSKSTTGAYDSILLFDYNSSNNGGRNCNNNENAKGMEDQKPLKINITEIVEVLIKSE